MVPGLSIGLFTCAETFSSKFVEFLTTSLGENNSRTWSKVYSSDIDAVASAFNSYKSAYSTIAPTATPSSNGSPNRSKASSSLGVIVGVAIGAIIAVVIIITALWYWRRGCRQSRSKLPNVDLSDPTTECIAVDNFDSKQDNKTTRYAPVNLNDPNLEETIVPHNPATLVTPNYDGKQSGFSEQAVTNEEKSTNAPSGWPAGPQKLGRSRLGAFQRFISDILIIIMSLCFLAYAILVRVYDGVPNDHSIAVKLTKVSKFVRIYSSHILSLF
jgi:hypothetical protein